MTQAGVAVRVLEGFALRVCIRRLETSSPQTQRPISIPGLKWARVAHLEMELDGKNIAQYRATTKIYFDIEQ